MNLGKILSKAIKDSGGMPKPRIVTVINGIELDVWRNWPKDEAAAGYAWTVRVASGGRYLGSGFAATEADAQAAAHRAAGHAVRAVKLQD